MRFSTALLGLCVSSLFLGATCRPFYNIDSMIEEVQDHQADADAIINYFTKGAGKHQAYARLGAFVDEIGNRVCGSDNLVKAEEWMLKNIALDGLSVHGEKVSIPWWTRGAESATLISPRAQPLTILGLGSSIATPDDGIVASAIVIKSWDELAQRAAEIPGKIVVFNQYCDWVANPITCYGLSVGYRVAGASQASKYGAVATLIRTVGALSIDSPHTGEQNYDPSVQPIPTACISIEHAEMLQRMQDRGDNITISLFMEDQSRGNKPGRNIVAELKGSVYPDETVIVSGHLDSWDVGQGAMDDGGGALISWQVLSAVKALGLKPKRTLRMVMWSCEEFGGIGAQQYYDAHKAEVPTMSLVMESDLGTFKPTGIEFTGGAAATIVMRTVTDLMKSINTSNLFTGGEGTDISPWMNAGVPGASLGNENDRYFWYHHSQGDMMTVIDPDHLDLCAACWTIASYVVADLDQMLPRTNSSVLKHTKKTFHP